MKKKIIKIAIIIISLAALYALYSTIGYLAVELSYPVLKSESGVAYFGGNLIMFGISLAILVVLGAALAALIIVYRKKR